MSSRFVAAGTDPDSAPPDDGWTKARQEVESVRTSGLENKAKQDDGKSLYEVLQANKGKSDKFVLRRRIDVDHYKPRSKRHLKKRPN